MLCTMSIMRWLKMALGYLYQGPQGSQVAYILLYVDDIILTASSTTLLQHLIDSLSREFDMTDLRALNYFLGISGCIRSLYRFILSQRKYAFHSLSEPHPW
ncbi:ribonuclease H-like domain-containing protein [Tanacetum coccineum]